MPAMKSRYSLPSTSVIVQPSAWSTTICEKSAIDCRPGAIALASRSKIALDLGPGTARRLNALVGDRTSFKRSIPCRGDQARAPLEALGQAIGDRLRGAIAVERVARPRVEVDDHRLAVGLDDGVAAEDLESERRGRVESCLAQTSRVERMTHHSFVAMIEPLEPTGVLGPHTVSHAVELDEVACHVLLRDDKRDVPLGETAQGLPPANFGRRIDHIVGLGRVEIVALDPGAVGRPRLVRVGSDNPADGSRHAIAREQLDHAVAIRVANGGWRVDDD